MEYIEGQKSNDKPEVHPAVVRKASEVGEALGENDSREIRRDDAPNDLRRRRQRGRLLAKVRVVQRHLGDQSRQSLRLLILPSKQPPLTN